MARQPCPECGADNRVGATTCRLCGGALSAEAAQRPAVREKLLRRTDFVSAAHANRQATTRLILLLLAIGATLGYVIGWNMELFLSEQAWERDSIWFLSEWGVWAALLLLGLSLVWTTIAMKAGDRIVLRMTGAREVSREEEPVLHNVVEEMAIAAGIPKPGVFLLETDAMNAFATGLSARRSAIGITRGLLEGLNRDELQAVVGHEMGHIVNLDMRYATAVSTLVGLIALVSDAAWRIVYVSGRAGAGRAGRVGRGSGGRGGGNAGVLVAVLILFLVAALAPVFAKLVQMAVSRQREFLADATSVRLTRNAQGMISALEKLSKSAKPFSGANRATQHLFIVNPFKHFPEKASRLMATHPPLEARIRRLTNLGA
ncbi:heat shock protein HtpX [Natronocella acetinitrilica]|uniref:Protease HtpX n=1 Tax=Natronocella acetinitrilica TaxID=414046 RepID=A0AAE3G3F0_9GAMM|nr:heat shock protein HtpX [Natronocella acetinitrilica]